MKKIGLLVVSLAIFAGISYANPSIIQQKTATVKKDDKKAAAKTDKKEVKKVPARKTQDKKAK